MTSGYDEKGGKESLKTPIPSPSTRSWKVELDHKSQSSEEDVIFAVLTIDGFSAGFLRLPNLEHLSYLRERLKEHGNDEKKKSPNNG